MKLHCVRTLQGLIPCDERDRDLLSKLKIGKQVEVEVKQKRNIKQLRLYWALIHMIFDQQDTWKTEDDLSDAIKCAVGHCEETKLKSGKIMVRPRSISFAKADQHQWEVFFSSVIQLVITKILPGVKEEDLRRELEQITGISR